LGAGLAVELSITQSATIVAIAIPLWETTAGAGAENSNFHVWSGLFNEGRMIRDSKTAGKKKGHKNAPFCGQP
jgi:hypothetical protein